MSVVGTAHPEILRLISATRESMMAGIAVCKPGVPINKIGEACYNVAQKHGFGMCQEFSGHGIGSAMHLPPPILHVPNEVDTIMAPGM
jgi:methionyl aminopeptidase